METPQARGKPGLWSLWGINVDKRCVYLGRFKPRSAVRPLQGIATKNLQLRALQQRCVQGFISGPSLLANLYAAEVTSCFNDLHDVDCGKWDLNWGMMTSW